jgi:nicotinate phosphoribosyltransferase
MNYFSTDTIDQIRKGFYSAVYFNRTKELLFAQNNLTPVTMQVFQKREGSTFCGVDEVLELLKAGVGYWDKEKWIDTSGELQIETLQDGDKIEAWEPVMHITGTYAYFAHLESIYLGILARRTLVATNIHNTVQEAKGKQVIFFADRFDYFQNQTGDGYAAKVGGATAVCTPAMSDGFGKEPVGTIPHALIAVNGGDTIAAARQFVSQFPKVPLIVLVDYYNDCVKTSLEVARVLKGRLWGVRIDTAENLTDASCKIQDSRFKIQELYGVNPQLVRNVRDALNGEGFSKVKIVVSGGFDAEKIAWFEKEKTPVDMYGVGSSLLKGNNDFTADVVMVAGKPRGKIGREYKENKRFKTFI